MTGPQPPDPYCPCQACRYYRHRVRDLKRINDLYRLAIARATSLLRAQGIEFKVDEMPPGRDGD